MFVLSQGRWLQLPAVQLQCSGPQAGMESNASRAANTLPWGSARHKGYTLHHGVFCGPLRKLVVPRTHPLFYTSNLCHDVVASHHYLGFAFYGLCCVYFSRFNSAKVPITGSVQNIFLVLQHSFSCFPCSNMQVCNSILYVQPLMQIFLIQMPVVFCESIHSILIWVSLYSNWASIAFGLVWKISPGMG